MKSTVIKVCTQDIVIDGKIDTKCLEFLIGLDIKNLMIVTAGAIALGKKYLNIRCLADKQAAAAIGQIDLISAYFQAFESKKISVAQILLTRDDLDTQSENICNTINTLFQWGVVPIINENDTTGTEDIDLENSVLVKLIADVFGSDSYTIQKVDMQFQLVSLGG